MGDSIWLVLNEDGLSLSEVVMSRHGSEEEANKAASNWKSLYHSWRSPQELQTMVVESSEENYARIHRALNEEIELMNSLRTGLPRKARGAVRS